MQPSATLNATRSACPGIRRLLPIAVLYLAFFATDAKAQQFAADNWWVLPNATGMGMLTIGEYYSVMYLGYGFAPGWEFDIAFNIFKEGDDNTAATYSNTAYIKRLIFEDEAQTKGAAVMVGTGMGPGFIQSGVKIQDFVNYWAQVPVTFPLFGNKLSWDLMPGVTWNTEYGPEKESAVGFTYATRMAIYGIVPQSAVVFEVFGTEGDVEAPAQYKAGVRWESKFVVAALTYGDGLEGNGGGGIELGLMFFTLPYF